MNNDTVGSTTINWAMVERITRDLENIPLIEVRGERIQQIDQQVDLNTLKQATLIRVADREFPTNLVDYLIEDRQIMIMLREGLRLGALSGDDLRHNDVHPLEFSAGEKVTLTLPPLDHLEKARALSLILSRVAYRSPHSLDFYAGRLCKLVLDLEQVFLIQGGLLDSLDLLCA